MTKKITLKHMRLSSERTIKSHESTGWRSNFETSLLTHGLHFKNKNKIRLKINQLRLALIGAIN